MLASIFVPEENLLLLMTVPALTDAPVCVISVVTHLLPAVTAVYGDLMEIGIFSVIWNPVPAVVVNLTYNAFPARPDRLWLWSLFDEGTDPLLIGEPAVTAIEHIETELPPLESHSQNVTCVLPDVPDL